jgi:MSHA pilin protein MshD
MCTSSRPFSQRGASLIELVIFIVIVGVSLAGILLVMDVVTRGSADPMVRKQAIAAAYSLLEEVELQDFVSASGPTVAVTQANRASTYHIVSDYNGFATNGIFAVGDAASASAVLPNYNVAVTVIPEAAAWNGIAAGSAVQVNVTVTAPNGEAITATGYRTAY